MSTIRLRCALAVVAPLALLLARPATCAAAQQPATTLPIRAGAAFLGVPRIPATAEERQVRISLEEHRLYVIADGRVVWSASIGTGTGEVLEGAGRYWDFSTPPGRYRVQRKELDPVWVLPDWYFVERDEPIPPLDSPRRRLESALGAAALYLTEEIAIHGTDQPELLGDAVSHGCIRMSNEDVLRLYEELEVGTPVIVH
jgi:lipoprotein-anchoring transpeptidase ErfK/SrfK